MNGAERAGDAHEVSARADASGQSIDKAVGALQGARNDPPHPGNGNALPHRMHRHDGARLRALVELLEMRRAHLLEPVGEFDLAHDGDAVAGMEVPGDPGLLEEGGLHDARLVDEVDLGHGKPRARVLLQHAIDGSDDGRHLAKRGVFNGIGM